MERFTVEQIRNYLKAQNSLGDIFYNLSEENIRKANPQPDLSHETIQVDETPVEEKLRVYKRIVPPMPEITDDSTLILNGGLEWTPIDDPNIVLDLISLVSDVIPYYTEQSFSGTESRFNIDGDRYRIISKQVSGLQYMEKLTKNSLCRHHNNRGGICLDCGYDLY